MTASKQYEQFLKSKIIVSENFGFSVEHDSLNAWLKPQCKDIVLRT